ncbi:MAG TPA: M23 family metallopeptidase [Longimicrobiaceae bacterium]|nr:M23 family metallopeptidase [Longimicrobiaceae bacterium]
MAPLPVRFALRTAPALLCAAALAAPAAGQQAQAPAVYAMASAPAEATATPVRAPTLIVPVAGVRPEELRDSFRHARSGGRVHDAIDIHAPRGTPVLATADGVIFRLHSGHRGGLALYQLDDDGRTRYYYAHLDRYAAGVRAGRRVRQGEVIGYVGDTGNAAPGDYHLHFSIAILSSRSRWWEGRNLNPYDVLREAGAAALPRVEPVVQVQQ